MTNTLKYFYYLIALLAGGALPLAFAPFNCYWLAVIAPACLLALLLQSNKKMQAACLGLLFGIGYYGVGGSWVFLSIYRYGNTSFMLALLITSLFVLFMALFNALQALAFKLFFNNQRLSAILLGFPATWVLVEWFRSTILTGFPWLLLGYSQTDSFFRALIPIVGVYGVSFVLLFCSGLLYLLFTPISTRLKFSSTFLFLFIAINCAWFVNVEWTTRQNKSIDVAMVQANIAIDMKWSDASLQAILQKYLAMSANQWQHDLVIWPEAAIPLPLPYAQDFVTDLTALVNQHHSALITGIPIEATDKNHFYNALIALGNGSGQYAKRNLVPFGEFVPFEKYLRGLIGFFNIPMSSTLPGAWQQPPLTAAGVKIAPYICYEVAFPDEISQTVGDAELIVALSDDNWFGHSIASEQQFQMARFHAKETGRYLLSATNSGITAIVDDQGRVHSRLPSFTAVVLSSHVAMFTGATPYMQMGSTPLLLLLLCFILYPLLLKIPAKAAKRLQELFA